MPISLHYIIKRSFSALAILIGVLIVTYILIYIAPGNPAYVWAGRPRGPKAIEAIENAVKELGLNKPIHEQIAIHVIKFFSGDWGTSIRFKQLVKDLVLRNLASTIELLIFSFLIAIPIGIFMGMYAALYRGSKIDTLIQLTSSILANSPRFWIAIAFILALQNIGLSTFGRISPEYRIEIHEITGFYIIDSILQNRFDILLDVVLRLIPPALAVATYPIGLLSRMTRMLLSESLQEEYVREAISLGLPRKVVVFRYALRGVIPALTQISGLVFAYSIVDAMAVEYVFGREGLGYIIIKAIPANDYPLIISSLSIIAMIYIIVNTIVDIVQASINPRVRV